MSKAEMTVLIIAHAVTWALLVWIIWLISS
jgi:hypothetical protein